MVFSLLPLCYNSILAGQPPAHHHFTTINSSFVLTPLAARYLPPSASTFPNIGGHLAPRSGNRAEIGVFSSSSATTGLHSTDRDTTTGATDAETDSDADDEASVALLDDECANDFSPFPLPERWDVLGLGQAMVDFSGKVDDEFLDRLGLEKDTRKVVNHEERGRILQAMDGCSYKAAAGGSLSNTLVALSRLGSHPRGGPALNVAMAGSIGSDPLGGFYRSKLRRANVNFLSAPVKGGTTGTVIVLTTPDAQRTMLAYQGNNGELW